MIIQYSTGTIIIVHDGQKKDSLTCETWYISCCVLDLVLVTGLLVVSSTEAVPVEQFLKLSQEQHRIQHSGEYTNPKWFIPNTLKYYVLLHDMSEGDEQRY